MIELRSITKRYRDVAVVDGLSLSVAPGELVVLLGGSGSGKTTTLKIINRLVEPPAGRSWSTGQTPPRSPPTSSADGSGTPSSRWDCFLT